jgi:hypothetical protein
MSMKPQNPLSELTSLRFKRAIASFTALVTLLLTQPMSGQTKIIEPLRPTQESSIALVYRTGTFRYSGDDQPAVSLDFHEPVVGGRIKFGGPFDKIAFTFGVGKQKRDADPLTAELSLLDIELTALGPSWLLAEGTRSQLRLASPVWFGYRRFRIREAPIPVNRLTYFHMGAGAGVAYAARASRHLVLEARSTLLFGLTATDQAEGSIRNAFNPAWDNDVAAHWRRAFGSLGLTLGAGFRQGSWRVPARNIFPSSSRKMFPYKSIDRSVRAGIYW